MVADYTVKGDPFVAGKPRTWFTRLLANTGLGINFDRAPDGKRFLAVMPGAARLRRASEAPGGSPSEAHEDRPYLGIW